MSQTTTTTDGRNSVPIARPLVRSAKKDVLHIRRAYSVIWPVLCY